MALTEAGETYTAAAPKEKMVDQTGAGDGYMAAVTLRLSLGDSFLEATKAKYQNIGETAAVLFGKREA